MLHQPIVEPFGDDDDANRAISSVLSTVGELSVQSRKLHRVRFRDMNAEHRQRALVQELLDRIVSRARSVHRDPNEFLEAARVALEGRLGRPMPVILKAVAPVDDETLRLHTELSDAEIYEHDMLRRLNRARENYTNAQAATAVARRALERHPA